LERLLRFSHVGKYQREVIIGPVSFIVAFLVLLYSRRMVRAQQPFYTDDTDVTGKGKFHLQIGNEYDLLQRTSFPAKTQNTTMLNWITELPQGVEVGVDLPWLRIQNAPVTIPNTAFGIGDTSFHVKYNFLKESGGSRWPALALSMNVQVPTAMSAGNWGRANDYY